jgi:hypothetical protein
VEKTNDAPASFVDGEGVVVTQFACENQVGRGSSVGENAGAAAGADADGADGDVFYRLRLGDGDGEALR